MPQQITFEELVEQIERIPAEWLDDVAQQVIDTISLVVERIEESELGQSIIENLLRREEYALDVFRLFLDLSQDRLANEINARGIRGDFNSIRGKSRDRAQEIAAILVELGILDTIEAYQIREWTLEDILIERYKQMRGRAIRGQQRGAAMEEAVQDVLDQLHAEHGLTYETRTNFVNRVGEEAKADFMIPTHERPSIVIEAKGYEATGSKLTDVLGDILKILQVKDPDTHFVFVTDGIGWYRRLSDLRKIVEYHHRGDIGMIYTRQTISQLRSYIQELMDLS
jgi:hypothetical protein